MKWRECILDPTHKYDTSHDDQRTLAGDLILDQSIADLQKRRPQLANEGKNCETCEDCQKMFRSFVIASFLYLNVEAKKERTEEESHTLLRVCFPHQDPVYRDSTIVPKRLKLPRGYPGHNKGVKHLGVGKNHAPLRRRQTRYCAE